MTQLSASFCHSCGEAISAGARFCSQCGVNVQAQPAKAAFSLKNYTLYGACTAMVCLGVWFLSDSIIGKKPSLQHASLENTSDDPHVAQGSDRTGQLDPEIVKLQEAVSKNPSDAEPLKILTRTLWNKLVDIQNPPPAMILDLVDALGMLLKIEPSNDQALLMMANLSFNQKVFDKSADYFARYLAVKSGDYEARASYASTLTFLGRHDAALKEIDKVLATHPNYFQAIAYKAITYAQMGKKSEAISLGQKALALSPNEEAKARFAGFLDSLQSSPSEGASNEPRSASSGDGATDFIRTHPIAGPKFVKGSLAPNGTVTITLKEFPMQAMPPIVKDSFLAKLKAAASADARIKKIVLSDVDGGAELALINLD